jgi:GTPase SAR1 family protein
VRGSSIIFIVFDVTRKETFESIPQWIEFIKNIENPIIIICGNKIDLNEIRYEIFYYKKS